MIHATTFGYPPRTPMELGQDAAEAVMAAEDASIEAVRFEEAPNTSKQDAVQAIIRHCFEAEEEVRQAGHPPDEFHARYLVGYLRRTLQSILEECRRLS